MKTTNTSSRHAHNELQQRLLEWANATGFTAAATNVATKLRDVVVDCAAYAMSPDPDGDPIGNTVVFTCAASRDEFLRFAGRPRTAEINQLAALHDELTQLECGLAASPTALTPASDDLFSIASEASSRAANEEAVELVRAKMQAIRGKWYGKSVVSRMATANCANQLILVCPPNVCSAYELPDGWGMLVPRATPESSGDDDAPQETPSAWFTQSVNGTRFEVPANRRLDLLQRIARAQSAAK